MRRLIAGVILAAGMFMQRIGYRLQPKPAPAKRGRPRKSRK